MRQGLFLKSYKYCLRAFKELYFIILKDLRLETFDKFGGYSSVVGDFLQS